MPQENDEDVFDCYGCGESYHVDDRYTSDYDGEWRCEGCYGEHLDDRSYYEERQMMDDCGVYDYSYRPDTMYFYSGLHGKVTLPQPSVLDYKFEDGALWMGSLRKPTELYIGMELETESCGNMYVEGADHVYGLLGEEQVYLKHDGSLSNGFEIVTMPMTMDWYMHNFNWKGISGLSDLSFKAWNRRSCGLHLHMSRSAFTGPKHLFKFFYLMYKNSAEMIKFAGRESGYASWDIKAFLNRQGWYDDSIKVGHSFMDMAKAKSINDNRYCAINLRNRATIELRFFRPSLRVETVQAAIQMADAAYRYTANLPTVDVMKNNALAFDSFRAWVDEGEFKDRYAILAQRISERVIG
jgi:hypothetical protein